MKIHNRDVDGIVTLLEEAIKIGDYKMCYDLQAPCLTKSDIATFSNDLDALAYDYEHSGTEHYSSITLIRPVLEAMLQLQAKASVFMGQEGGWSIPLDIQQIERDHHFKLELNNTNMNFEIKPENLKSMEESFLYTGMKNISRHELINNMSEGKPEFSLEFQQLYPDGSAAVKANCKLSDKQNYYPKDYEVTVSQEGKQDYTRVYEFKRPVQVKVKLADGEEKDTLINSTVTLKEAYNQMCGRAINKDYVFVNHSDSSKNRKYNNWEIIDFTKKDDEGNHPTVKINKFSVDQLKKEIKAHPLLENKSEKTFNELVDSLRRGNIQLVNYIKVDGEIEKLYFKANPDKEMINKYDQNMNPIILSLKREQEISESQNLAQDKSKEVNQAENQNGEDLDQKKNKKQGLKAG